MKRVIVDYAKLTGDILNLLVEKFPDGYENSDIISFRNAKNELIEAVEVKTEDTIYLVKVSTKLANRMEKFDEDDLDDVIEPITPVKGLDLEDDDLPSDEEEEEEDLLKDKGGSDDGEDDDEEDFETSDNFDDDEDEE
ncbi:MAG: DNA primase [Flavobacterium sp.]|jgi:DNA-directed RNA polymerase subunit delta